MNLKQIVAGLALFGALILSALSGIGVPTGHGSAIPAAYACDNNPPPVGMDPCNPTPTPPPPPHG